MKRHKHVRLPHFHYSGSYIYFVTICTLERKRILLEQMKQMIEEQIGAITKRFHVEIDTYVVMPNHIHILIWVKDTKQRLSYIVGAFKSLTTRESWRLGRQGKLWQTNYYEHVVRNERAVKKIREYIINNPEQERYDLEDLYIVSSSLCNSVAPSSKNVASPLVGDKSGTQALTLQKVFEFLI